jgi:hypothetical protein
MPSAQLYTQRFVERSGFWPSRVLVEPAVLKVDTLKSCGSRRILPAQAGEAESADFLAQPASLAESV